MLFKKNRFRPKNTFFTKSDYRRRKRELIIIGAIVVIVALLTVFESRILQLSTDLPISNSVLLFIVSYLTLLLVILLLFLIIRNIIKLLYDRKRKIMGSRLRVRLVLAFVTLSLLPTIVLFIFSVTFISDSIRYWVNTPIENSLQKSLWVAGNYYTYIEKQSAFFMERAVFQVQNRELMQSSRYNELARYVQVVQREFNFDGVEVYSTTKRIYFSLSDKLQNEFFGVLDIPSMLHEFEDEDVKTFVQETPSGDLIKVAMPIMDKNGQIAGFMVATTVLSAEVIATINNIAEGLKEYESLKLYKDPIQMTYIIALAIVSFVVLFCSVWVGFYLAKTISIPIRELAEGTRRVAQGNLDITISKVGDDEIGSLVNDFNQMIQQLRTNRYQLDMSTSQLRQQNIELEQRRQYIEIVLESVSAGVISLDALGYITTINKSAENILNIAESEAMDRPFMQIISSQRYRLSKEALERLDPLRSSQNITLRLFINEQARSLLMTSTPLQDGRGNHIGAVIVLDDLTELEKGERMAAWREVARRVAHEVKNPLTPIALSAERLSRKYGQEIEDPVFEECTRVIIDHVELIRNIVNEFSSFARFPSSILQPGAIAPIIEETLALYREANLEIAFDLEIEDAIPQLHIDKLRLKQVFINLLDNAAAAMQNRGRIKITVKLNEAKNQVLVLVADNGPGLDDDAKALVFEPDFSTKATGMGLGLTIVSTIIADHKGTIHATDNEDGGATFVIKLPVN